MTARARGWTCRRVTHNAVCGYRNPPRTRKCGACGKPRPPRRQPAHMRALDLPYEAYVQINGGEFCGICGKSPKLGKRLQRDHEHRADGTPRGLLCFQDNRRLGRHMTIEWMRAALAYLERAEGLR